MGFLASPASRGLAPHEGLGASVLKLGRTRPAMETHCGPQAGRAGYPHIQNADKGLYKIDCQEYGESFQDYLGGVADLKKAG